MFDLPPPPAYSTAASDDRFARRLLLLVADLAEARYGIAALRRVPGWSAPSADVYAEAVDRSIATLSRAGHLVADARDQAIASARMQ